MAFTSKALLLIFLVFNTETVLTNNDTNTHFSALKKSSTVLISVLVRNKEHILPFFLSYLERLDYPKDRISLLLQSDHNGDRSIEVLEKWLAVNKRHYHSVITYLESDSAPISGEMGIAHWPNERYTHIISLRERSLAIARRIWADFVWVLDADALITNPDTLSQLIKKGLPISAPMLRSDGLYSNFWCGMTEEFYYQRTEDYNPILTWKNKGCHSVPMIHSSVLIDLRLVDSDNLTYNPSHLPGYNGPHDDIITFARSANMTGLEMYVCNDEIYGYVMVPLEKDDQLSYDLLQLRNLKLEVLVDNGPLEASEILKEYVKEPEDEEINVDKIFMINLKRRPDRRKRMMQSFAELHLNVEIVNAVDGQISGIDRGMRICFNSRWYKPKSISDYKYDLKKKFLNEVSFTNIGQPKVVYFTNDDKRVTMPAYNDCVLFYILFVGV